MTTITCERHPDQISDATPLRVTIKGVAYNAPSSTLYGVKVTTRYFRAAHRSGSDRIGFTLSVNGGPQDAPRFGFFSVPDAYRAAKLEIQEIFRSQLPACKRCGGAGGWVGWPGFTCYECGGSGVELPKDG